MLLLCSLFLLFASGHGLFFNLFALLVFFPLARLELAPDQFQKGHLGPVPGPETQPDDAGIASMSLEKRGARVSNSLETTAGSLTKARAWRRAWRLSRFPSVIIFSAMGRTALARSRVVRTRSLSKSEVTMLRNIITRWGVFRPSFFPATRCLMNPVSDLLQRSCRYSGFGAGTGLPSGSSFIPKDKPISERISLISFKDLRPKFLVFSISASVFWTSSPMVLMSAFFRQL